VPDQRAAHAESTGPSPRGAEAAETALAVPATEPSTNEELAAMVANLETEVRELEDRWRRALADLDNVRKRFARDIERERANERARVVAQFLPVVDNLELALEHAGSDPNALIEGVRVVRDQAVAAIERLGYTRIDDVGVPFDPARHEAMGVVSDPNLPPGTVVRVARPGYGEGDNQLRPQGVVVATGAT
jgi:molecular chaperone GrpE